MTNKNTYGFASRLLTLAKKHRMKVAIGIDQSSPDIINYLKKAKKIAEVIVVGNKIPGFECFELTDPQSIADKLLELVDSHAVDAVVRGQIHPRFLFLPLFQRMGRELSYFNGDKQVSMLIFENKKTKRFFVLGTAELGQGFDLEQKKYEALAMAGYLKSWGIAPFVGVMAMRRGKPKNAKPIPGFTPEPLIDRNYEQAEALVKYLNQAGIKADLFNIEFETAISAGVNIISPSIGAVGNAFSRALVFFSENWEAISMLPLHFRPLIVMHTFKTGHGKLFYNMIVAAAAEAVMKKYKIKN